MDVFSPFEAVPTDSVEPGDCVTGCYGDQSVVAMRVQNTKEEVWLMLSPGHLSADRYGPAPTAMIGSFFGATVLRLRQPQIVVPHDPRAVRKEFPGFNPPAGALFAHEGRFLVTPRPTDHGRETQPIDVRTGERFAALRVDGSPWFTTWSVAVPDAEGRPQTICTVTAEIPTR